MNMYIYYYVYYVYETFWCFANLIAVITRIYLNLIISIIKGRINDTEIIGNKSVQLYKLHRVQVYTNEVLWYDDRVLIKSEPL